MNRKENDILVRAYNVLRDVPGAHIGGASTQSVSIEGMMSFAKDMNAIKQPLENVLYYVRVGMFDEANEQLVTLERWKEIRKQANWEHVFPFPLPE